MTSLITSDPVDKVRTMLNDLYLEGLLSARPAAGTAGRLYYATDTKILYRDTGSSWGVIQSLSRGSVVTATSESRTNTAYGLLATPDRVQGIVLPAGCHLVISYQATWQESVNGGAAAAIFIGSNQLKYAPVASNNAVLSETSIGAGSANVDKPLATNSLGLNGQAGNSTAYTGDVTTGQVIGVNSPANGNHVKAFADPGTYDISVQFKAASGSVTAKNRRLYVAVEAF
jgi:hypothetical protein